jgi:glyoxylase-like metal-dependent hydrolase (beta-lactamase superfamily II)
VRIEQLADGVFASIAEDGDLAVGNAGFVDLGGETLVFDTHVSLAAGRELRTAAERVAPARTVVLSHWHGDHVYGAAAFDAHVVATARTAALMRERTAERLAELKATPVEDFADTPFAELVRTELPKLELRFPDETFEVERDFGRAKAITFGGGHTLSDAVLWLPEERILFAADLVVHGHPWIGDGDPKAWPGILARLAALEPETVVPGHGPVSGPEAIAFVRAYLDAFNGAGAGDPNPFPDLPWPEMWERNLRAFGMAPPDVSGTPYRLLERTGEGEFGAWRAVDEDGRRYIAKNTWCEDGVTATELLRAEGYPAPRYVLTQPGLSVQEELPGDTLPEWRPLGDAIALQAIELDKRLAAKRVPNAPPWPERLRTDLFTGHYYVDLAYVERESPELLRRCRDAFTRAEPLHDPGDLVHFDYTTANILAAGGRITGVVDWDGVCNGDRLFDLVTLWYYTRTPLLRDYVLAHTSRAVHDAYLAAVVVRQVAYSLKFHSPDVAPKLLADALELSA